MPRWVARKDCYWGSFRISIPLADAHRLSEMNEFLEIAGLRVTVDKVVYVPNLPSPPEQPYSFVYFITIHNDSETTVTIRGRKWVVRDTDGDITAVEGDGVVGEFPEIGPGETFSYNSRHVLATKNGEAEGSYLGVDELGRKVIVRIPRFQMAVTDVAPGDEMWA